MLVYTYHVLFRSSIQISMYTIQISIYTILAAPHLSLLLYASHLRLPSVPLLPTRRPSAARSRRRPLPPGHQFELPLHPLVLSHSFNLPAAQLLSMQLQRPGATAAAPVPAVCVEITSCTTAFTLRLQRPTFHPRESASALLWPAAPLSALTHSSYSAPKVPRHFLESGSRWDFGWCREALRPRSVSGGERRGLHRPAPIRSSDCVWLYTMAVVRMAASLGAVTWAPRGSSWQASASAARRGCVYSNHYVPPRCGSHLAAYPRYASLPSDPRRIYMS